MLHFSVLFIALFAVSGSYADECEAIRDTLLHYAGTQCGSELLNVLPPLRPNVPTTTSLPTVPTQSAPTESPVQPPPSGDVVVGSYYPNWFVYRKHYMGLAKFGVSEQPIDADLAEAKYVKFPSSFRTLMPKITHLYYAFLNVDKNCWVTDKDPDASWYGRGDGTEPTWIVVPTGACKGAMNDMLSLKTEFPHLKLLISLGGWTFSENFSACAKRPDGPKQMFDSFNFYVSNSDANWGKPGSKWAGVDFDWEHPGTAADHTNFDEVNDWPNYAKLIQYFRTRAIQEGRSEAIFTSAIGVGDTLDLFVANPAAGKSFCDGLDFINMMTYDLHGKWDPTTGHNAQFCQIDSTPEARPVPKSLPWAVRDRVEAVVSICGPRKVALGLPNYSPAWGKIPSTNDGLYQTATDTSNFVMWSTFSDSDKFLTPQGILHFWDQKEALAQDSSFKVHSKTCPPSRGVSVPVKWMYSPTRQAFACYEDEETVQRKAEWARLSGLRGFFFWDISQDRDGALIEAARKGWGGLPVNSSTGSPQCVDSGRPDFNSNPDGSESDYKGCTMNKRVDSIKSGEGCAAVQVRADKACNGVPSIAVGGERSTGSECMKLCTPEWGTGPASAWVDDKVYYICEGESLEGAPSPTGAPTGGPGVPTAAPTGAPPTSSKQCDKTCKSCKVTTQGKGQGVTDDKCHQDCVVIGNNWWPCNMSGQPNLCVCVD